MSKTIYAYPVEKMCGKISKDSKVIHACTASGKQITYLQGERDLNAHPITPNEVKAMSLFERRAKAVGARLDSKSETYAADMAAYREQLKGEKPIKSFKAYIWSIVASEITE